MMPDQQTTSLILPNATAPFQAGITTPPQSAQGGSNISDPHPDHNARRSDWVLMFDANEGQRHVKSKTTIYLPATSGMRALSNTPSKLDGEGLALYVAYLTRAFFPDLVKETVRALTGILDREPANIELPDALEDMRELATPKGESLNDLLVQIHINQLLYGRLGLLLDVDPNRDLPLLVRYPAPQILNWDDLTVTNDTRQQDDSKRSEAIRRLLMVVLDETRFERDTGNKFTWNLVPRYRVLNLGDAAANVYTSQVERDGALQSAIQPAIRGKPMEEIPFVFINTTDLATAPAEVPLINLANLALAIYRGEADHRSALFMSGQDTLVITGYDISSGSSENPDDNASPIIGSGAYLNIPDPEGDAKFIGPDSNALSEQRASLEDDYKRAGEEGIKLLSSGAGAEAAETLRIRVAGRTATLQTIAMTSATGLETALRLAAVWVGADPEEVKVEPNLDFITEDQDPADLIAFATAKKSKVPLSWKSVHNWLRQKDFTELTFDEELEQIDEESNMDAFDTGGDAFIGEPGGPPGDINNPAMVAARQAAIDAANGATGDARVPPEGDQEPTGDDED
jgi:hypothetical protein